MTERSERQPSEEELRAALEEEMKRIRVEDVLVQTAVTLVNLAGRRLTPEERDLAQAKLGIDGARALLPLLSGEPAAAVRNALGQLQMVYAREAQGAPAEEGQAPPPREPRQAAEDAERERARSKIWTPPGT